MNLAIVPRGIDKAGVRRVFLPHALSLGSLLSRTARSFERIHSHKRTVPRMLFSGSRH